MAASLANTQGEQGALNCTGVLDPTCGSGTFLYHAALRIGNAATLRETDRRVAGRVIANLVHGIDIHPVAVEMSKATLLRAVSRFGEVAVGDLNIVQGDSLITDRGYGLLDKDIRITSPAGRQFSVPHAALEHGGFTQAIPAIVEAAAAGKKIPKTIDSRLAGMLEHAHSKLARIIGEEGDSVWSHHILNLLGPSRLERIKVNRIVTNPPWVRISNIQDETRKKEIKDMAKDNLDLWPGGKNATGFDIAALFVRRCRQLYMSDDNDRAGWLVNYGAIRAGNWEKFRQWHEKHFSVKVYDYSSLREPPFSTANSCALFQTGKSVAGERNTRVYKWMNRDEVRIEKNQPWHIVKRCITSQIEHPSVPKKSEYISCFSQGATLVPQPLVVVSTHQILGGGGGQRVTTRTSSKANWKHVKSRGGEVPSHWVHECVFSNDLFPYATRPGHTKAIIPLDMEGRLETDPASTCRFWAESEQIWTMHRTIGESNPQSLLGRINHHSRLSNQLPLAPLRENRRTGVLYNAAGKYLRAARFCRLEIVESKCYWWEADSEEEAAYLVSILNAPSLQAALKMASQSDRDFHLHFWKAIPIKRYDSSNLHHRKLADLCTRAEELIAKQLRPFPVFDSQIKVSRAIRRMLDGAEIFSEVDKAVQEVVLR